MYDSWGYLIPAETAEADAKHEKCSLSPGKLNSLLIGFPAGCGKYDVDTNTTYRLARCRVRHQASPIAPRTPTGYIGADDFVVPITEINYRMFGGGAVLTWELWNLDDTYPHELWLGAQWTSERDIDRQLTKLELIYQQSVETNILLRNAFRL